jgi:tRNA-uridine 2-sulfurtransferase
MSFPLPVPAELRDLAPPGTSVLLGVSGGVDSSFALALLAHLDCDVHCVTFKNFCTADGEFGGEDNRSCCSLDAIEDARRLAARYGVRHWVSSVEDLFREHVIDPFVRSYLDGRTPNPCVNCNTTVRFPQLARRADELGVDLIATGHYARTQRADGEIRLLRGLDADKDQSYFLHGLDQATLGRCVFPLGWYDKTQVRAAAAELGITAASRPDSQEICFVPDDDRTFLFAGVGGDDPGDIVDVGGQVLGRHRGLIHYTVGQRRGLGVSAAQPLYVLAISPEENSLLVGPRRDLDVTRVVCDRFLRTAPSFPERGPVDDSPVEIAAQIRYRHRGIPVAGWEHRQDRLEIELAGPAQAVAPGQFLVLYEGDHVVGGARIVSAN